MTKLMQNELLYIEEHLSCQNYMATVNTGFKYIEFSENYKKERKRKNRKEVPNAGSMCQLQAVYRV